MNVQELVNYCIENNISLETQIAIQDKDDYMLIEETISYDVPYFGNCRNGSNYLNKHTPLDDDGEPDYDKAPKFLLLGTGY